MNNPVGWALWSRFGHDEPTESTWLDLSLIHRIFRNRRSRSSIFRSKKNSNNHQNSLVLCTPPFEWTPFWWALISGWAFISENTVPGYTQPKFAHGRGRGSYSLAFSWAKDKGKSKTCTKRHLYTYVKISPRCNGLNCVHDDFHVVQITRNTLKKQKSVIISTWFTDKIQKHYKRRNTTGDTITHTWTRSYGASSS